MIKINISDAVQGMELGESIISDKGAVLLKQGIILTQSLINGLIRENVEYIIIDDHTDAKVQIRECLTKAQKYEVINSIKAITFDTKSTNCGKNLDEAAITIVNTIAKNNDIAFDLLDIRNDSDYSFTHSLATAELSIAIAQEYRNNDNSKQYNTDYIGNIATAAFLMNIGKSCKNDKIRKNLDIKDKNIINLDEYNEYDVPEYGHSLTHKAYSIKNFELISCAILFSRTNENGTNCPTGREEGYINYRKNKDRVISKILHVADWYTNLIVLKKENGKTRSPAEAMEIILCAAGKAFDKKVVDIFLHHVPIFPIDMPVLLSDGQPAIVVGNNLGDDGYNYRPIVQTADGNVYNLMDAENRNLTIISDEAKIKAENEMYDNIFTNGISR